MDEHGSCMLLQLTDALLCCNSILMMCVYAGVGHPLAVLSTGFDPQIGFKDTVFRVIVFHADSMSPHQGFKCFLSFDGLLSRRRFLEVNISESGELVHVHSGVGISLRCEEPRHLSNQSRRWGDELID